MITTGRLASVRDTYPALLEGIGERAAASDYDVLWITSAARIAGEADGGHERLFRSQHIDGPINAFVRRGDDRPARLRGMGYASVVVGRPDDTSIPHVDAANRDGGYAVGHAFVRRGYDRIAMNRPVGT